MDKAPFVPAHVNGVVAPPTADIQLQGFLSVTPPEFPEGCELVLMRPGDLKPAGVIPLPKGCMLLYAEPIVAERLRQFAHQQNEQAKAVFAKAARELGQRG